MRSKRGLQIIALFGLLAGCAPSNEPALRIGGNIWPGYEPMYLARKIGRYDPNQIHLIDFPSAVEVTRAYRNGVIDVAALTADEAISVIAGEPGKHRIILLTDVSNGADCILAQPSYVKFEQLKGRRIGVEANALGGYVLLRALQLHGMSIHDVQPVPMSIDQHVAAFEKGAVDAVVTFEPNRSTLLADGAQEVFTSKEIPNEIVDTIVTRVNVLATRRAALAHFVRGWFDGLKHLRRAPQDAARFSAVHEHTAPETFLDSLHGVELLDRQRNLQLFDGGKNGIEGTLEKLARSMRAGDLLPNSVDVHGVIDKSLVEQAAP